MNESLILTRYLYNVRGVYDKLKTCIIQNEYIEALFWAYELYYSGLDREVINFLFEIIKDELPNSTRLLKFLSKKITVSLNDPTYIATIIKNVIVRLHIVTNPNFHMFVIVTVPEIASYQTTVQLPAYTTISKTCKYSLRITEPFISESDIDDALPDRTYGEKWYEREASHNSMKKMLIDDYKREYLVDFCKNWLYYAVSKTPIWKNRVLQYHGKVDANSKTVIFENDDCLEQFYELYGFEPESQNREILDRIFYYLE